MPKCKSMLIEHHLAYKTEDLKVKKRQQEDFFCNLRYLLSHMQACTHLSMRLLVAIALPGLAGIQNLSHVLSQYKACSRNDSLLSAGDRMQYILTKKKAYR